MFKRNCSFGFNFSLLVLTGSLIACGNNGKNTPADTSTPKEDTVLVDDSAVYETESTEVESQEETQVSHSDETASKQRTSVPKQKQKAVPAETLFYDGRVGDDDVTVQLVFRDNQVNGFIVREGHKKKRNVSGSLDADGNLMLTEFFQSKKVGRFVGKKHRRKRRFSGDYLTVNGDSFTFKFSKTSLPDDGDDIYQ